MMTRTRLVSAVLALLLLAGPLVPIAGAQQPAQPPAPDLFQETLKAQRDEERSKGTYDAGAVAVNVFLVPGRAITCVVGERRRHRVPGRDVRHGLSCGLRRVPRGLRRQVDGDRRRPAARRAHPRGLDGVVLKHRP